MLRRTWISADCIPIHSLNWFWWSLCSSTWRNSTTTLLINPISSLQDWRRTAKRYFKNYISKNKNNRKTQTNNLLRFEGVVAKYEQDSWYLQRISYTIKISNVKYTSTYSNIILELSLPEIRRLGKVHWKTTSTQSLHCYLFHTSSTL